MQRIRTSNLLLVAATVAVALTAGPTNAQQPPPAPPPGQWLLDHGLAYGLAVPEPDREDAEYVLTWITAATYVSPDLAEAHLWRYDLLSRLNRPAEALAALQAYCEHAPRDLSARLNLIDIQFQQAQTVEDRIAVCEAHLQAEDLPGEVASDLHRRLAQTHLNRADLERAARHAELAVERFPQNLPARTLLAEIEGRLDQPATRIDLLLNEVAANPASAQPAWRLARALDALAMHTEAQVWYEAAMQACARQNPQSSLPSELLLDQARSYFDSGDDEQTAVCCNRILTAHPATVDAAILLVQAARCMGREDLAGQHAATLNTRFREMETQAVEQHDAAICHQIASFHIDVKPDSRRAVQFALLADRYQPHHPRIRRTLGAAYLESGKYDQAVEILSPLAHSDQHAALALARAQMAQGDADAAAKTLRSASALCYSGITYQRIIERLRELHQPPAPPPDRAEVLSLLEDFDYRLLDFPLHAAETLDFRVNLERDTYQFGQPLRARFTLANSGSHSVTLGQDRMVNPRVSVSVKDTAHQGIALQDYLTVSFDEHYVLPAGRRIETSKRLSIAAAIPLLRHQPQRRLVLEFTFILDPVMNDDGSISSALLGVKPVTLRLTRPPVDASAKGIERLRAQLRAAAESQRLAAVETALALILERYQSLQNQPHTYSAVRVDPAGLTRLIFEALKDSVPVVRARALSALVYLDLDEQGINTAAPLISDPGWLPRLLAVEMFAKRQGPVFLPVLERLCQDPNPQVAKLAQLYRDRARQLLPKDQKTRREHKPRP